MRFPTLALLALATLFGCSDSTASCGSNDDCPEGYTCDDKTYVGECVQYVRVERCRDSYCQLPDQRCVSGECRAVAPVKDAGPVQDVGASGGSGGGVGGSSGGGTGGQIDPGDGGPDVSPDAPEPVINIASPIDGDVLIDSAPILSGRALNMVPGGRLSWSVEGVGGGELELVEEEFRVELDLPAGRHTVKVLADQGQHHVEASVTFRLDYFVRANAGRLEVAGQPFRFVGVDAPELRIAAFQQAQGGPDRLSEVFQRAHELGITVIRTPAYDDRPEAPSAIQHGRDNYNEAGLVALDHVIAEAANAGVKLILPLVDGGDTLGGPMQYLRWNGYVVPVPSDRALFFGRGSIREHFLNHVRTMLTRTNTVTGVAYAREPAILAWEAMGSVDVNGLFDPATSGADVLDFFTDVTQVMKANAPEQLAGTGEIGYDLAPGPYGASASALSGAGVTTLYDPARGTPWQRIVRLPTVDYGSIQILPEAFGFPRDASQYANLGAQWMRGHAAVAALEGKPLFVVQAAMDARAGLTLEARRSALSAWLDEARGLEVSGFLVGNLYSDGFESNGDPFAWTIRDGVPPGTSPNDYGDVIQQAASAE